MSSSIQHALREATQTKPLRPLLDDLIFAAELPRHRIAIVGSVDVYHADTPALCSAIGQALARRHDDSSSITLFTGANADIPKRLAQAYHNEYVKQTQQTPHVYHLAPDGFACNWDFKLFKVFTSMVLTLAFFLCVFVTCTYVNA